MKRLLVSLAWSLVLVQLGSCLSPLSYIHSMRDHVAQHLQKQEEKESTSTSNKKISGAETTESFFHTTMKQLSTSEAPLYNFKGDVIENDKKNVENIFSLLADISPEEQPVKSLLNTKELEEDTLEHVHISPGNAINQKQPEPLISNSTGKKDNVDLINTFSKKVLTMSHELEDLASTITKVRNLYMDKKAHAGIKNSIDSQQETLPDSESSSAMLDVFLEPSTLERMWGASVKATNEDQLLDELTTVIIGAESREGSALTLDPVTIIALLTLGKFFDICNLNYKKVTCY